MLMAVSLPELQYKAITDTYPLLMEHSGSSSRQEHVINITKGDVASTSNSHDGDHSDSDEMHYENRPSTSTRPPISQPPPLSPTSPSPRNVSFRSRGDNNNSRPRRSPLNSGWWISIELLVNVSQIVAAIIVLSLSRHEKPRAPLFTWVIGYTAGCIATLPHLYWRYIHRNGQGSDQEPAHSRQSSFQENPSDTAVSFTRTLDGGNRQRTNIISRLGQNLVIVGPRLNALVDHFKMALDCFFAVWFVVGNVWIFGGHSSPDDSPNLYRLCIAFLTFSCIGYAMPFILCATICCCLPCIISVLGFREDLGNTRGATSESINALPTYKFKSKKNRNREESETGSEGPYEGGIFAPGTDKERIVSAEDAVCCICLARYLDNDELRELPCSHFFHTECVDKWLAINALCPLCKSEVGNSFGASAFFSSTSRRPRNWRARNDADTRV